MMIEISTIGPRPNSEGGRERKRIDSRSAETGNVTKEGSAMFQRREGRIMIVILGTVLTLLGCLVR